MKISTCARFCFAAALALLLAGCATTPKIDWSGRVGSYSHDQTVTELGPPDREAKLTDGTTIGEWLIQHGRTHVIVPPSYGYYSPYGYGALGATHADTVTSPDWYLRLTFAPDGKLTAWKKIAR